MALVSDGALEYARLPSFETEFVAVTRLFSYCDESGKQDSHDIIVFNALVDGFENWERFSALWMRLLRHFQLSAFTAKEALRFSQPYGMMKPGTEAERTADVAPFVQAIVEGLELGVVSALSVRDYKLPTLHKIRLNVSEDPHYFAFYYNISELLKHFRIPEDFTTGLVLDDDEAKAVDVYKFLLRMKRSNPTVKRRIPSICFMDDTQSPQLQAVDLFTYLSRLEAERRFIGKANPYKSLCDMFNPPPRTGREKLEIAGGYLNEAHLRDYLSRQVEREKDK